MSEQNQDTPAASNDVTLSYDATSQNASMRDTPIPAAAVAPSESTSIPNIDSSTLADAPSDSGSGQLVTDTRSFWSKLNAVLDTSPIEQAVTGLQSLDTHSRLTVGESHNPYIADVENAITSSIQSFNNLLYSMTTPKQIGILLAAGEYKAFAALTNLWYGARGAKDMFSLNTDEPWTQRLSGGVQLALSYVGMKSIGKQALRESIQNGFNISGNLVDKIANKIEESHARMSAFMDEMDGAAKAEIAQSQNFAKGIRLTMSRILSDAADEALVLKQNTEALYNILFSKATTPVTTTTDLRATIVNAMSDHGVPAKAIPSKVFRWIPKSSVEMRPFTADEEIAAFDVKRWISQKKYGAESIRGMLLDQGFDSDQIDLIMSTVAPDMVSNEASAEMVQHTKSELYDAAEANGGTPIGLALGDAQSRVDKMLERYFAKKPGGAEALKDAREAYTQYKNGVGQGVMQDLLFAKEQNDRNIEKRVEMILSAPGGNEIRSVLKGMGIDISPLEQIVAEKKTFEESATAHAKALEASASRTMSAIDLANSIIPNRGDLSGLTPSQTVEEGSIMGAQGLAKKTNYEIRLAAIHEFNMNARSVGIRNVGPLVSTIVGGIRLAAGSAFGLFALGSGVTRMSISNLLKNPSFQEWVIQEGEVDPSARARVIRALKDDKTANYMFGYLKETSLPSNMNVIQRGAIPQTLQQVREPQNQNRISAPKSPISIAGTR